MSRKIVLLFFAAYLLAWHAHLFVGTAHLRGFWGDGSIEFLIHLSRSYVFGYDNHWIHLFPVGFPREGALFLKAIMLQPALWLNVQDPAVLKYTYVFWQYALPGYFYLALILVLAQQKRAAWAVFPLLSWTVASVAVDWNAVNDTRWAVPIFWIYLYQVLFAPRHPSRLGIITLSLTSSLMLAGLYESVVAISGLACAVALLIWRREGNKMPTFYAIASLPAALRAGLAFVTNGHAAPNSFQSFIIPALFPHPYVLLILLTLAGGLGSVLLPPKTRLYAYPPIALIWVYLAVQLFTTPMLSIWDQVGMRFDYIAMSFGLMVLAAGYRCLQIDIKGWAMPAGILGLATGTLFWIMQIIQTDAWQICQQDIAAHRGDRPIILGSAALPLIKIDERMSIVDQHRDNECLWDWTTPWTDLVTAENGVVRQWPLFTFWQDFAFVQKNGKTCLQTNNWTLTSPSYFTSEACLPLKTLLYDMTPLYEQTGDGDLFPRSRCLPVENLGAYWHDHLQSVDDAHRQAMFVCPRSTIGFQK